MTPARTHAGGSPAATAGRGQGPIDRTPMADGLLPVQQDARDRMVDRVSSIPMRGAESLGVIAAIGVIAWIFAVLVPEYCIQAMADASSMGASLIGMLFVWIAVLPILILGPLVVSYWLQYLGRVLVFARDGGLRPAPDARPELRWLVQRAESLVRLAGPRV